LLRSCYNTTLPPTAIFSKTPYCARPSIRKISA